MPNHCLQLLHGHSCSFWLSLWPRWITTATSKSKLSHWSEFLASHLALAEGGGEDLWRTKPQCKFGWSAPGGDQVVKMGDGIHLWNKCAKCCLSLQTATCPILQIPTKGWCVKTGLIWALPEPPEEAKTSKKLWLARTALVLLKKKRR